MEEIVKKENNDKNDVILSKNNLMNIVHSIAIENSFFQNSFYDSRNTIKWLKNVVIFKDEIFDEKNSFCNTIIKNNKNFTSDNEYIINDDNNANYDNNKNYSNDNNNNSNDNNANNNNDNNNSKSLVFDIEKNQKKSLKSYVTQMYTVARGHGGNLSGGGNIKGKFLSYLFYFYLFFLLFYLSKRKFFFSFYLLFKLSYFILFYFILYHIVLFCFILFYFILFYFMLFYFILF